MADTDNAIPIDATVVPIDHGVQTAMPGRAGIAYEYIDGPHDGAYMTSHVPFACVVCHRNLPSGFTPPGGPGDYTIRTTHGPIRKLVGSYWVGPDKRSAKGDAIGTLLWEFA